jgi:hypothetical protein
MEIVPRLPSERVVRAVLGVSVVLVAALSLCVAFGFAEFSPAHFVVASAIGALLAAFLVRPLLRANAASRAEGSLDRFECVAVAAGRSLFVAGLLTVVARAPFAHVLGFVALGVALALVVTAMWRDRMRARFLRRVYAKEHEHLRIARDADVRGYELLPPLLSGMITDAVLAHVDMTATYRTSGAPRPIARVTASLSRMLARLEKRSRTSAGLAGVLVTATFVTSGASPLWHPPDPPRGTMMVEVPVAPSCAAAGPYFSERLEQIDGVARAALLTHSEDATIAPGDGVLLVAPNGGGIASDTLKAHALAVARSIPCNDPLALTVADPSVRSFAVDATLSLEPEVDEPTALADANAAVRELFEPNARAVFAEHVGFGATEKLFGYRVRFALRRVAGVKSAKLTVDGSDRDVALAPRDFPTLASLTLHVAH